jgi:hypothetical protein
MAIAAKRMVCTRWRIFSEASKWALCCFDIQLQLSAYACGSTLQFWSIHCRCCNHGKHTNRTSFRDTSGAGNAFSIVSIHAWVSDQTVRAGNPCIQNWCRHSKSAHNAVNHKPSKGVV